MLIIGINGHPLKEDVGDRKANVALMLDECLAAARDEGKRRKELVETKTIHLVDIIKAHHDGIEESMPDWIKSALDELIVAKGIIFATPVNWFDKSDLTHTFLSYVTSLEMAGFALEGKKVSVLVNRHDGGAIQAAMMTLAPMNHMGCDIVKYGLFYRDSAATRLGISEVTEPKVGVGWMESDHLLVGQNMVRAVLESFGVKIEDWGLKQSRVVRQILQSHEAEKIGASIQAFANMVCRARRSAGDKQVNISDIVAEIREKLAL